MSRTHRTALAAIAVAAMVTATAGAASAVPGNGRTSLPGSIPSWATSAHKAKGTDPGTTLNFRIYLDNRGGSAAAAYATAVSTPGNTLSGKFLTPGQFHAQFSPAPADTEAVAGWLGAQGFHVGHIPNNNKYVEANGTVSQAAAAFSTTFSDYLVNGTTLRSNDTQLSVPASVHGVEAVVGLDESMALVKHETAAAPPSPVFVNGRPCSDFWGQKTVLNSPTLDGAALPAVPSAYAPCGYAGAQLQGAYGMSAPISSGNDGSGVTVAVIDGYASPTAASDLANYSSLHGLPAPKLKEQVAPGTYIRATNKKQDPAGWAGEESLDLEAVHTMAPGASLLYVGAPNNYRDLDATLNHVVDSHSADIITNSYGYGGEALPTGYIKPQLDTQIQAAATGISVFFSSGDNGDETAGVPGASPTPDWPASSPWVTAVGGTSLGVTAQNTRLFELGWQTGKSSLQAGPSWSPKAYQYGSGGGTSRLFTQPSYQQGVVPAGMATANGGSTPMRVVPDASALGDPTTGMLVGQTQSFPDGHTAYSEYRIGGTSLSSPLYAGMWALAVQKHGPYGLANPAIYATRGASLDITKTDLGTYPGAVRVDYKNGVDATGGYSYTARWFDFDELLTIHVVPGYDNITGVGSPKDASWLTALQGYSG